MRAFDGQKNEQSLSIIVPDENYNEETKKGAPTMSFPVMSVESPELNANNKRGEDATAVA